MAPARRGFTLIELLVVVVIIGVLASIAIPKYRKAMENSKADDAISTVQMIGTTNRMYALDRGRYAAGNLTDACYAASTCTVSPPDPAGPCELIYCNFLGRQGWDSKPYNCYTINAAASAADPCDLGTANNYVSCCKRRAAAGAPYNAWGYTMNRNGQVKEWGGAPVPPS